MFESINPATGHLIKQYPAMTAAMLAAALEDARSAARAWARVDVSVRASMLERLATLLEANQQSLVRLIVQEVGKPLAEARAEIDKCALLCRYYATHAADFLASESVETAAQDSQVSHQ
ncbi:MAG TPA: NADP-dependent succinic semialdehyde dehydrogenase, partial [Opitutae bacterium]|nr:NADP-dependent succinic semialdehyde dehydrogenase [Opitutae bacterium]